MRTQQTRLALFASLILLIAVLVGCGGSGGDGGVLDIDTIATQTAAAAGGVVDEGEGQPLGEGGDAPTPTPEAEVIEGDGGATSDQTAEFDGIAIDNLNLDTFRVDVLTTTAVQGDNAPNDMTISFSVLFDRQKPAVQTETDTMGMRSKTVYIDGMTYVIDTEGVCTMVEGDPMELLTSGGIDMALSESDWSGFSLIEQGVTVNDVQTDHYRFQGAVDVAGLEQVDAELWLAADGGYPVRFHATETLSEGSQGTVTLEYNLTNINQALDIQVPPECEGAG
jgi:hypothetical protein